MEKAVKATFQKRARAALGIAAAAAMISSLMVSARIYAEETETEETTESVSVQSADDAVVFSTDYPGVTMQPGDTSTFSLYLTNTSDDEMTVELTAKELPDGWEGSFKGSSNEVSMVHIQARQTKEDSPSLSYSLTIPEDTEDDTYTIVLNAQGDGIDADLPLTVKVDAEEASFGAGSLTTDYAEQEGSSGTSFSYSLTLANNSSENQTYTLTASGMPEGWTATFTPSDASTSTSSVPVDAGATSTITAAISPSQNVTAGEYEITLTAASATETLELPVTVKITGTYGLTATTPTGNLSVKTYAGEEQDVTITLQNTGNIDLTNVSLSAQASTDWETSFDQDSIDSIAAGESVDVTMHITPASSSILGDYVTAVTASNDEVSSEVDLRVSVQNHTTWGIVAVAIIAVLIIGLALIIRKFGRR